MCHDMSILKVTVMNTFLTDDCNVMKVPNVWWCFHYSWWVSSEIEYLRTIVHLKRGLRDFVSSKGGTIRFSRCAASRTPLQSHWMNSNRDKSVGKRFGQIVPIIINRYTTVQLKNRYYRYIATLLGACYSKSKRQMQLAIHQTYHEWSK